MKNKKECSSCSVCLNICPVQAIEMNNDKYGFSFPQINKEKCIDCGACDRVCKKIENLQKKYPLSTLAVQSNDTNTSKKSSSGGMFAELAKYVLSQNGIVFGCTMFKDNDRFVIKHIAIDNINDLYKLQGSKYVQSDIGETYKEAKSFLEQGKQVLYSGTPCQIAGLKAFLDKDYKNLLTVDLSCTGVPSQALFNDYIKFLENKYKQKIMNFEFRNKEKLGWTCGNALITFENGKQKQIHNNTSSYMNLFINGGIHRNSCYNCEFIGTKRVSDITIGDAWGIEIQYPELIKNVFCKNKGISLVLINTDKGKLFFERIQDNIIHRRVSLELLKKYNGPLKGVPVKEQSEYIEKYRTKGYKALDDLFKKKQGYSYYYNIIKQHTPQFIKNIIKIFLKKEEKLDCVIMTWSHLKNYGAILTSWALKKAINNLGFTAKIIKYANDDPYIAKPFNEKYCVYTDKKYLSANDFSKINNITNTYIVGADNQFNLNLIHKIVYFTLGFCLPQDIKKASISTSMSFEKCEAPEIEVATMKTLLNRFDYLSVREYNGVDLMKNIFDCQADWVIDPVFLLKPEEYIELSNDSKINAKGKILSYVLYPNKNKNNIIQNIKNKEQKAVIDFTANEQSIQKMYNKFIAVEDWLKAIIDADLIISDSYHCICFALIFHKPFICLSNDNCPIRFKSLMKMFNLEDIITTEEKIIYNDNIDYSKTDKIIDERTQFANNKIMQIITSPKQTNEKQEIAETELKKIPKRELYAKIWYKEDKLFYYGIIVPFVKPIKNIIKKV